MRKTIILVLTFVAGIGLGTYFNTLIGDRGADPHLQAAAAESHAGHNHGAPSDHSAAADMADWCAEHRVPESECTLCRTELVEKFKQAGNWCGEHELPESHCRKCNPFLTFAQEPIEPVTAEPVTATVFFPAGNGQCNSDQAVIRFASAETAARVGLTVEPALPAVASATVDAPAELVFDKTATAAVTTAVPATVIRWLIEPGQAVTSGTPLALLESPDVAQIKSDCLETEADWQLEKRNLERARELDRRGLISALELEDAIARETAARSRLEGLRARLVSIGLAPDVVNSLSTSSDVSPRWIMPAAQSGNVLERRAPLGELLPAGTTLALLGDPGALWIEAHVREQDLGRFREGQMLSFTADGHQMARTEGRVIWISQYLDPQTRTGLVRARVLDPRTDLQANRFGRIQLPESGGQPALSISKDAVQWDGCCNIVFVQEAVDRYRPHKVIISRGDNRRYAVTSGLAEGDLVVTSGSFLLKTELKKESLGVGCAGE